MSASAQEEVCFLMQEHINHLVLEKMRSSHDIESSKKMMALMRSDNKMERKWKWAAHYLLFYKVKKKTKNPVVKINQIPNHFNTLFLL